MDFTKTLDLLSFADVRVVEVEAVTQTSLKASAFGVVPGLKGNTKAHNLRTVASVRGVAGIDYAWLVNIARVKAGAPFDATTGKVESFVALPTWGEYVKSPAGERLAYQHYDGPQGPFYLPMSPTASLSVEYRLEDGTVIDPTILAPHRSSSGPSKRQGLEGSAGILWRKYGVRNLARVRVGSSIVDGPALDLHTAILAGDMATVRKIADELAPPAPAPSEA